MKDNQKCYNPPVAEVVHIMPEGVLCASNEGFTVGDPLDFDE